MKTVCQQALDIYLDVLHSGEEGFSQAMCHYFTKNSCLIGSAGSSFGIQDCYEHLDIFKGAFPDLTIIEAEAFKTVKYGVVTPWKVVATHTGSFFGIAPTQKRIEYKGCTNLFLTPYSKIQKWEYFVDLQEIFKQLQNRSDFSSYNQNSLIQHLQKLGTDKLVLTVKQTICLAFLCQGLSSKYIAQCTKCSPKTIECHTQAIKEKLGCHFKEQLIDAVRDTGLYYAFRDLFDMLYHAGC